MNAQYNHVFVKTRKFNEAVEMTMMISLQSALISFMHATKQVKQSRGQYQTDRTHRYTSVTKKYIACASKYSVLFFTHCS